ncbi:helix-turn-helix domain-containing protein [Maribellus sediminis]|uniref:helix-turn-helix domain-containing protein n=1 Tax=Maribellus sediminis TaxID=2696285 RepID=UPI001431F8DE|nr:helix-turn-helix transcriptional regulator [Maribellus sediminis]
MNYRKIFLLLFLFLSWQINAMEIKGRISLEEGWQPVVFLAALNSPVDLFVASPDFILAETFIQADGSFEIRTDDVPENPGFYRLYLVKADISLVEFNTTENRNYIHLLLDRNSTIELQASVSNNALVIDGLAGSAVKENLDILNFDREYVRRGKMLTGDLTKVRRDFLTNDMTAYIRQFVSSQENALVGLYALYHIDDKNTDFLLNSEFYFDFQQKLEDQFPINTYTDAYNDLLKELIGFRDYVCEMPGIQPKWKDQLIIAESFIIVLLLVFTVWLIVTKRKLKFSQANLNPKSLYDSLTTKQQEILGMLANGKTNKEIAQELFVEVSTVKTHINNIYRQLNVTTRKEAIDYFRQIVGQ